MPQEAGVKSARRVFQILEYFGSEQRELSVADVAKHYGFPASSTSALMRTMTEMGYLHFDRRSRAYRPTPRLPLVAGWINNRLFRGDRVLQLMNDLNRETGETIILGAENGRRVRYIHVTEGTGELRLYALAGQSRPYATTAIGLALLSTWDKRRIVGFIRRENSEEADPQKHINVDELLRRLEQIRADGFVRSIGGVVSGGGAVATLLPRAQGEHLLAIAVGSLRDRVLAESSRWADLMRTLIHRHFGDVADA